MKKIASKQDTRNRAALCAAIVLAVFLITTACNLSTVSPVQPASQEEMEIAAATAVAATMQAAERIADQQGGTQPGVPQPEGTQPAPTVPAGQPASQVIIGGVSFTPTTTVYYGFCQAGETTQVNIQAGVSPSDQVASVTLYYWFADQFGNTYNNDIQMAPAGANNYSAVVNVGAEGPLTLSGDSGWLYFYAGVVDKNGAVVNSNIYNVAVWYCPDQVAQPPVAPPGSVTYVEPTVNYFIGPSQPVMPGDEVTIEWEVFDAPCGVYLDTNPVNTIGYYRYTVPLSGAPATIPHQLIAYGEPCSSPSIITRNITVTVDLQSAVPPSAPTNFSVSITDVQTYQFTWEDNSNNETGFHIYSTYSTGEAGRNATSYTVKSDLCGLQPIIYYVTAYNGYGESAHSNSVTLERVDLCPPEAPTLVWEEAYQMWEIVYSGPWGSTFIPAVFDVYRNGSFYYQTSESYLERPACETDWNAYVTVSGPGGVSTPSNTVVMRGRCP